jgi:RNA polymerase sigma-70 factor (sigma-E family)
MMDDRRRQDGSRAEFDRFVAVAADGLLRAASLITWDVAEAEDLVQECLFRVARRWPRVRKMEHPAAYARTVLVHLVLDEGKRRTRRRSELQEAAAARLDERQDDGAGLALGRVEASADLQRALGELPPRQRVALVLRYFEDLSEAEAAEAMGCSVGTVKSTTSRALDRLRSVVERPTATTNGAGGTEGTDPTDRTDRTDRTDDTGGTVGRSALAQDGRTNEGSIRG